MNKDRKRELQRKWLASRREQWLDANGPCVKCESNENLEIDHVDPSQKSFNIRFSYSWEKLRPELAKCQVLCEKCHLIKTTKERYKTSHGKLWMYQKGCRCDLCKAVKSKDNKKRKR